MEEIKKEEKSFHQLMKETEFNWFSVQYGTLIQNELETLDSAKDEYDYCTKLGIETGLKKAFEIFKQLKDNEIPNTTINKQ